MKRICPGSLQYAIMRIDPVSTVAHFADADALKDAQALNTKKYLVYLDHANDLPLPTSQWFEFQVSPIGTTLHPEDPARGVTANMAIPISPNLHHPGGRAPVRTLTPFPFGNCYHWAENMLTVRVRRNFDLYDDSAAVRVSAAEHVRIDELLWSDSNRVDEYLEAKETEAPHARTVPLLASPSSEHSRLSDRSYENEEEEEECFPLVDLWFDLDHHLSEDNIPDPSELYKECDMVKRIVRTARARHPEVRVPRRNGTLDEDSESDGLSDTYEDYPCNGHGVYTNGSDHAGDDDGESVLGDEDVPVPQASSRPISIPQDTSRLKLKRNHAACSPPQEGPLSTSPPIRRRVHM
ncbi:hypothetical protein C8Q77DRAFT_1140662 [Trametes polyzona]|nr:hypothetical protein C8Q77DRAFT_1140662 [Trametes polyzona]